VPQGKISGWRKRRTDHRRTDGDRFQADIAEVVHTHQRRGHDARREWWTPAHGLRRTERD
jgi:hypothetical protein